VLAAHVESIRADHKRFPTLAALVGGTSRMVESSPLAGVVEALHCLLGAQLRPFSAGSVLKQTKLIFAQLFPQHRIPSESCRQRGRGEPETSDGFDRDPRKMPHDVHPTVRRHARQRLTCRHAKAVGKAN